MTQAGTSPPGASTSDSTAVVTTPPVAPTPAPAAPVATAPAPTAPETQEPPDLTQDLTFAELAEFLPDGVIASTGAGIVLNITALSLATNMKQYGVSQAIYNLILAAEQAQAAANAGRLATQPLNAIVNNFTELRGSKVRFAVTLNGHAELVHNLQGIKGGI